MYFLRVSVHLHCTLTRRPEQNFSNIRSVYSDKLKKLKESRSGSGAPSAAGSATPNAKRAQKHSDPIIMISSSPTALITMHNVKQFLEESTCVSFPCFPSPTTRPELPR
jgi:hypothetical protein